MKEKELPKKYQHEFVEKGKYDIWKDKGYFKSDVNSNNPPFSIVIPPPNVTGKLHLGHAWDTTLQDLIIRYKKMNGFDTLYLPGMDHAGIATQAKVEERLRVSQNIFRQDLGREKFIEQVWEWKEEYATIIREQWAKLGLSLDYSREQFTLNQNLSKAVEKVFIDLYNKGLIYRGKRIIAWDPVQKTALSNIEVIYQEETAKMYYFKYFLEHSSTEFLTIATTRPETMFADQCVIVNPNDERYKKYWNQKVINPANNMVIDVIQDEYVDSDYGSGIMKCTPAHDANDYEIGLRHNLAAPLCLDLNGYVNSLGGVYQGQDRFIARENLVKDLTKKGLVVEIKEHIHQIGLSERSGAVVESLLSDQWFVKMDYFANKIIAFQKSKEKIKFYPNRFDKSLLTWMENIQDWCISRQLWWGHQIPAWYHKNDATKIYVGHQAPNNEEWYQDEDVLDTWFSSALWPFTVLGWNWDTNLLQRYFPTNCLVTGYDIIFFWVSRMMFQSLEFTNKKPFNDVLIHGLIRDANGKKMSKSLDNGIDPIDVINEYGADTLRYFLVSNSAPGQDLRYSIEKVEASWNFINKLWNAARYVQLNLESYFKAWDSFEFKIKVDNNLKKENAINCWILTELSQTVKKVKENMDKYEFVLVGKELYDFVWNKFCSWYIELSKVNLNNDDIQVVNTTKQTLVYVLKEIVILLHPFIPFVTEEIYQTLELKESIMLEQYPNLEFNYPVGYINDVITLIPVLREFRRQYNIPKLTPVKAFLKNSLENQAEFLGSLDLINDFLGKMVNSKIQSMNNFILDENEFINIILPNYTLKILNVNIIDPNIEQEKHSVEITRLEMEIKRSQTLLENPNFINKADPAKIKIEAEKYAKYLAHYQQLKEELINE